MVLLCEELGDVLLQVVFHARMEEEAGGFSIADVLDGLCRKLILRHPHVFGDAQAADAAEVLTRWDQIKRETKGQDTLYATLAAVARSLPALMRADKLVKKAAKADTASFGGAETWNRLSRGAAELPQCSARGEDAEKSVGEFLFSAVAAARLLGVDPERALERACDDFAASVGRAEGVLPPA
jgi:tetrapyrrole methylase family protein/MazG family protein